MSGTEDVIVGTQMAGMVPAGIGAVMLGAVATAGAVPLAGTDGNIANVWKTDTSIIRSDESIVIIRRQRTTEKTSRPPISDVCTVGHRRLAGFGHFSDKPTAHALVGYWNNNG
jgi:hypothetical protein